MKPRDFLIIVRAGDKSLHPRWLGRARNWDLMISFFGDGPIARGEHCRLIERVKGPKWIPLHDFIKENWSVVSDYKYVLLPDDDLLLNARRLSKFFSICERNKFSIAQPSLNYDSYFSHRLTLSRPGLRFRVTNFVEIMAPCFRIDILEKLLPSFLASRSGWGLDLCWWNLLDNSKDKMAVVDSISMTHTRPIGGELYSKNVFEITPAREMQILIESGRAIEELKAFSARMIFPPADVSESSLKYFDAAAGFLYRRRQKARGKARTNMARA